MEKGRYAARNVDGERQPQQGRAVVACVAGVAVEAADGRGAGVGRNEDVAGFQVSVDIPLGIEGAIHRGQSLQQSAQGGCTGPVEPGADEIGESHASCGKPFEQQVGAQRGTRAVEDRHLLPQVSAGGEEGALCCSR